MSPFARYYFAAPFEAYGPAHLGALGLILLAAWAVYRWVRPSQSFHRALAFALLALQAAWVTWLAAVGAASLQTVLPLHPCSASMFVGAAALLTQRRGWVATAYFWCISGAAAALLFPDLGLYGFPHFAFFHYMLSHGLLVCISAALAADGFRPNSRDFFLAWGAAQGFALLVVAVNWLTHSNYMYLFAPPAGASPLGAVSNRWLYGLIVEAGVTLSFLACWGFGRLIPSQKSPQPPQSRAESPTPPGG